MRSDPVIPVLVFLLSFPGGAHAQSIFKLTHDASEHARRGDYNEAEQLLGQAIERRPARGDLYFQRGSTRLLAGNAQGAVDDLSQAIAHGADISRVYFRRALAFEKLGRLNDSLADYTTAIKLNSEFIDAFDRRGEIYKKLGDEKASYADLFTALKLENLHKRAETDFLKKLNAPAQ